MQGKIGLEIHTYLITKEKLFCRCAASRERGLVPNTNVCPVCTGMPGAKPLAPNEEAVKKALLIGLMLQSSINSRVVWMRKHYSWPDLPKGYQTTISGAHAVPLGVNGSFSEIPISSMHLEEDPASWDPLTGCVDYNRSGLPLVEIVTAPSFTSSAQVADWLGKLVHALAYLKIADSNAGIKVDVNVSIPGKTERVEVKNINSIESVVRAIDYELERQSTEGSVRETRRFDADKGITISMRKKEQQDDYRFIADPDLPSLQLESPFIKSVEKNLPELPEQKLRKLITHYKIDKQNAEILAKHLEIVTFFEAVSKEIDGKFALPWVTIELLRVLNWNKISLDKTDVQIPHFVKLLRLVKEKKITELQAKQILNKFVPKSFDPSSTQGAVSDKKELEKIIIKVLEKHEKAVKDFKEGDAKALNFLMGEIMKATERRADYRTAQEILKRLIA